MRYDLEALFWRVLATCIATLIASGTALAVYGTINIIFMGAEVCR